MKSCLRPSTVLTLARIFPTRRKRVVDAVPSCCRSSSSVKRVSCWTRTSEAPPRSISAVDLKPVEMTVSLATVIPT